MGCGMFTWVVGWYLWLMWYQAQSVECKTRYVQVCCRVWGVLS